MMHLVLSSSSLFVSTASPSSCLPLPPMVLISMKLRVECRACLPPDVFDENPNHQLRHKHVCGEDENYGKEAFTIGQRFRIFFFEYPMLSVGKWRGRYRVGK